MGQFFGIEEAHVVRTALPDHAATGKLVRVNHGAVFDVAVDFRRNSPQFRRYVVVELSAENGKMSWIPAGFGHGFLVLSDSAGFACKVTDYYVPGGERALLWDDPGPGMAWDFESGYVVVSSKDREGVRFKGEELFS